MAHKLPEGTVRINDPRGYKRIKATGHPLSRPNGWAPHHRYLVYEHVAGKPQRCAYCNYGPLPWRGTSTTAIHVDHINDIAGDDRLDNLTPACHWCNLIKSTWPITYHEHMEAIDNYGHLHPVNRPTMFQILIDQWMIPTTDIGHNLRINREHRRTRTLPDNWYF